MMKLDAQLIDKGRASSERWRVNDVVLGPFDVQLEEMNAVARDQLKDVFEADELDFNPAVRQVPSRTIDPETWRAFVGKKSSARPANGPSPTAKSCRWSFPRRLT